MVNIKGAVIEISGFQLIWCLFPIFYQLLDNATDTLSLWSQFLRLVPDIDP